MSTDRLTAIGTSKEGAGAGVRLDLIRLPQSRQLLARAFSDPPRMLGRACRQYHQNANVELFGHVRQLGQELVQFLLSVRQLATAAVVNAEAGHDAVDYQETVFVAGEGGG